MNGNIIIGAGLAGLSAALTFAQAGRSSVLISVQNSERAQSVLAEGGINAAADTMGESDSFMQHYEDTMRGGVQLADPDAVYGLTKNAPEILKWLISIGVPFNAKNNAPVLRNFGGQKKKRTAYAKSSTGKIIMSALTDEVRKYEAAGLIKRYPHHRFLRLITENGCCHGAQIADIYSKRVISIGGSVIVCCGGLNGFFPNMTTGTTANTGDVQAELFRSGVKFANLEMIQYHPTTIAASGKRCLVTEAARGEGGRLFIRRNGRKWYFMEEKYPELKNLMPRDIVAREMYNVRRRDDTEGEVYLDMTGLSEEIWQSRLPDLRKELIEQTGLDPAVHEIPVREGIHYFMGGIYVNEQHETSMKGLYAAGECACQYHGANRLGGNSMLGAIYGGKVAAENVLLAQGTEYSERYEENEIIPCETSPDSDAVICSVLINSLGIVRNEFGLISAEKRLNELLDSYTSHRETARIMLAKAMVMSARARRESRGAHYREDYPNTDENYRKTLTAEYINGCIHIGFIDIPERRDRLEDTT
jgi:succinate dehydrogenase / fumarate reductase flavoprotein subunit